MRGIADGASGRGGKWHGREVDLVDIVVANVTVEMGELRSRCGVTPTGLEVLRVQARRVYADRKASVLTTIAAPSPPPARRRATARWSSATSPGGR